MPKVVSITDEPVYREPRWVKDLPLPQRDFQRRAIAGQDLVAEIRGSGLSASVNPDGTVTLYHGTSSGCAQTILRHGRLQEMTFLSPEEEASAFGSEGAASYARAKGGKVIAVRVDARDVHFNQGTGEVEAPDGLIRGGDGVWRAPARYALPGHKASPSDVSS